MPAIKLDELTWPKIRNLLDDGIDTILLPVGTLEAHGKHAPVGTDNFCAEEIAWRLGEQLAYPVAPTLNYGITTGLIAYPGSSRIPKPVYSDLMTAIFDDFFAMGFRRIIVINGHGGNTETLSNVVKEMITVDRGNRHFIIVDWWMLDAEPLEKIYGRPGGHAALDETACIAAYRPELLDESALDPDHSVNFTKGIISLPYSASVLVYEEGDSTPDFDREKAQIFMGLILGRIETVLRNEIELFESTFGPKGG